jgi:hypothetical protein
MSHIITMMIIILNIMGKIYASMMVCMIPIVHIAIHYSMECNYYLKFRLAYEILNVLVYLILFGVLLKRIITYYK